MPYALENSRVERFCFEGRAFYLKRDDLLDECLNGNKARKFYALAKHFPEALKMIISHGGVQSNAMYALSCLAQRYRVAFQYYVKQIPSYLRTNPSGNYKMALQNGMKIIEVVNQYDEKIKTLSHQEDEEVLFIPQGGAFPMAEEGVKRLALELDGFASCYHLKNPVAITSSGTGTTAFYLKKHCRHCDVYTVPCVGGKDYLLEQMAILGATDMRNILDSKKKYIFGKPYQELLGMYHKLLKAGVVFDLLYDVKTWLVLLESHEYFRDRDIIFIHSGGVQANGSMLARYTHVGL